jgi:hypothetical protein
MTLSTIRSAKLALLSAALLALPSCSDNPPPKAERTQTTKQEPGVPGSIAVDTTTITANIASVFGSTREVVLDLPDGKREVVTCGPAVVNFDQLRPGDQVKVTVTKEVAVAMGTESDPPDTSGGAVVALAPKGAQPGAIMASVKQETATVTEIDLGHHTATLLFPDGQTRTITVRNDVDLTQRKVGEKVVIRKTNAMALRVEKPQQK